ncbi:Hypothetical predicted protein [Pelobates cultripes]|uniref:Uncharacterized protein n=1 Tax=Pelobates cultripes TaxID=61616 RepID=A0AAD1SX06_PELCU|nr:Hypothetical predicted protein [Pelobates cultripes]
MKLNVPGVIQSISPIMSETGDVTPWIKADKMGDTLQQLLENDELSELPEKVRLKIEKAFSKNQRLITSLEATNETLKSDMEKIVNIETVHNQHIALESELTRIKEEIEEIKNNSIKTKKQIQKDMLQLFEEGKHLNEHVSSVHVPLVKLEESEFSDIFARIIEQQMQFLQRENNWLNKELQSKSDAILTIERLGMKVLEHLTNRKDEVVRVKEQLNFLRFSNEELQIQAKNLLIRLQEAESLEEHMKILRLSIDNLKKQVKEHIAKLKEIASQADQAKILRFSDNLQKQVDKLMNKLKQIFETIIKKENESKILCEHLQLSLTNLVKDVKDRLTNKDPSCLEIGENEETTKALLEPEWKTLQPIEDTAALNKITKEVEDCIDNIIFQGKKIISIQKEERAKQKDSHHEQYNEVKEPAKVEKETHVLTNIHDSAEDEVCSKSSSSDTEPSPIMSASRNTSPGNKLQPSARVFPRISLSSPSFQTPRRVTFMLESEEGNSSLLMSERKHKHAVETESQSSKDLNLYGFIKSNRKRTRIWKGTPKFLMVKHPRNKASAEYVLDGTLQSSGQSTQSLLVTPPKRDNVIVIDSEEIDENDTQESEEYDTEVDIDTDPFNDSEDSDKGNGSGDDTNEGGDAMGAYSTNHTTEAEERSPTDSGYERATDGDQTGANGSTQEEHLSNFAQLTPIHPQSLQRPLEAFHTSSEDYNAPEEVEI